MALPLGPDMGPLAGRVAEVVQPLAKAEFFADCVSESVERISRHCPRAVHQVTFGIEEVPPLPADPDSRPAADRVPLATAVEASADAFASVVLYRRPLEHRARSRAGLRILVHRTVVEQLAVLTGLEIATLDPDADLDDTD